MREAVGTGARGTTLLGLNRGAEALGFNSRQVKATSELIARLSEVPLPLSSRDFLQKNILLIKNLKQKKNWKV